HEHGCAHQRDRETASHRELPGTWRVRSETIRRYRDNLSLGSARGGSECAPTPARPTYPSADRRSAASGSTGPADASVAASDGSVRSLDISEAAKAGRALMMFMVSAGSRSRS